MGPLLNALYVVVVEWHPLADWCSAETRKVQHVLHLVSMLDAHDIGILSPFDSDAT